MRFKKMWTTNIVPFRKWLMRDTGCTRIQVGIHAGLNWSFETAPNPDSRDMTLRRMEVFRAVAVS